MKRFVIVPLLGFLTLLVSCNRYGTEEFISTGQARPVSDSTTVWFAEQRITPEGVHKLRHLAPGQTATTMRKTFSVPYASDGMYTEYYPLTTDDSTWVAVHYNPDGTYRDYSFSVRNQVSGDSAI